jgi:hypothetical protein
MSRVLNMVGFSIFAIGFMLAFIGGIFAPGNGVIILILMFLGIIIGILNISSKEIVPLLVAAIALVVVGHAGFGPIDELVQGLGTVLNSIVDYFARLMAPAAVIAAIRALWNVGFPER